MAVATVSVAAGFHSDVTNLLKRFSEAEKIEMAEFTKIWRDMKFIKVFMYRENIEIVLFTEECYRILLRIVLGQHPLPFRVGGLFCLYSMYHTQPSEPKIMIRLVPDMWRGLMSFIDECQLEPWEDEVKFVFWKLAYGNAFLFVAKPNGIGLVATAVENESNTNTPYINLMDDYMNSDHQFLCDLHNRYMSIKESLDPSSAKTVQMVDSTLLTSLEKNLEVFQGKHNPEKDLKLHKTDTSQSDDDDEHYASEENRTESEDEDDTLERRRKVRKKHQASQPVQSKSRRHRVSNKAKDPVKRGRGRPRKAQSCADNDSEFFLDYGDRPFQHLDLTIEEEPS